MSDSNTDSWDNIRWLQNRSLQSWVSGFVVGHTLVNNDVPVVAIRVINVSVELCTIGRGTKVADCTPVIEVAEVRDKYIRSDRPQGESLTYSRNWSDHICEMVKRSSVDLEKVQRTQKTPKTEMSQRIQNTLKNKKDAEVTEDPKRPQRPKKTPKTQAP